jgi:hypothetical protein
MSDKAFISYSHRDQGFVGQLGVYLAQEEIPPWVDNQLQYGESWQDTIVARIKQCAVFILTMSSNSRASRFVLDELSLAMTEAKTILPILIDGEPFEEVKHIQFADMRRSTWPNYRFVERLRDLVNPRSIPSTAVQRRRVEVFVGMSLRMMMGSTSPITTFGVGFGIDFGIDLKKSFKELGFDELEWVELMQMLNEQLPGKDFGLSMRDYHSDRFPQIDDLIDHLARQLDWSDIRRIDIDWSS